MNTEFKKQLYHIINGVDAKFGIAISDIDHKNIFLYNADEVFPAASVIKIPILIELFRQAQNKKVSFKKRVELKQSDKVGGSGVLQFMDNSLKPTVLDLAKLMTVVSDNAAANMIIDIIGMESVNAMMKELGIVKTVLGRKLHIDPNALTYKNFATPHDIMLLLEKIYRKDFLRPLYRDQIIDILINQQYNDKISRDFPEKIKFAHKTGEVTGVRSDAGIVTNISNSFIIVVLTKDSSSANKTDEAIGHVGKLALQFFGAAS